MEGSLLDNLLEFDPVPLLEDPSWDELEKQLQEMDKEWDKVWGALALDIDTGWTPEPFTLELDIITEWAGEPYTIENYIRELQQLFPDRVEIIENGGPPWDK